jgi:hypothetical protein
LKLHSAANLVDVSTEWPDSFSQESRDSHSHRRHKPKKREHFPHNQDPETEDCFGDSEDDVQVSSPNGIQFCSRSEAICAELLQRYVPHFELQNGLTFQVPIGRDQRGNVLAVDFLVDGVLFEYHPARLFKNRRRFGDFLNKQEYRAYTQMYHSLRREQREFFQEAMRARVTRNYYAKRRAILDQHPTYRRMELVVATTPEEFYALILKRFGKNVPRSVERFMAIFEELRSSLPA